jgi:hypothetical protein
MPFQLLPLDSMLCSLKHGTLETKMPAIYTKKESPENRRKMNNFFVCCGSKWYTRDKRMPEARFNFRTAKPAQEDGGGQTGEKSAGPE